MNTAWLIGGVIVIILIIVAILIFSFKSSSNQPLSPSCICPAGQKCDQQGRCVPTTVCGEKVVPSGQHCGIDALVCSQNPDGTYSWQCNGKCATDYEGQHCRCYKPDIVHTITDVCTGQVPVCDDNSGKYVVGTANNCNDLMSYLEATNGDINNLCSSTLNCSSSQKAVCRDGPLHIECENFCPVTPPSDACTTCSPNCNPINDPSCSSTAVCMCDATTNNTWQCQNIMGSSSCPPKPATKYCHDGGGNDLDLVCIPCDINNQNGYINYCPGSGYIPLDCLMSEYGLSKTKQLPPSNESVWITKENLPVFPAIDNDKCKNSQYPTDKLVGVDYGYQSVDNPNSYLYNNQSNLQMYDPNLYYYPFPGNPASGILCLWDDHPVCQNGGRFVQECVGPSGNIDCDPVNHPDWIPQHDGACDCSGTSYYSNVQQKTVNYVGESCQYGDNTTCQGNGIANPDGSCTCISKNGVCIFINNIVIKQDQKSGGGGDLIELSFDQPFEPEITNYTLKLPGSTALDHFTVDILANTNINASIGCKSDSGYMSCVLKCDGFMCYTGQGTNHVSASGTIVWSVTSFSITVTSPLISGSTTYNFKFI